MTRSFETIKAVLGHATGWIFGARASWPRLDKCARLVDAASERLAGVREGGMGCAREYHCVAGWLRILQQQVPGHVRIPEKEYLFLADSVTTCIRGFQARLALAATADVRARSLSEAA